MKDKKIDENTNNSKKISINKKILVKRLILLLVICTLIVILFVVINKNKDTKKEDIPNAQDIPDIELIEKSENEEIIEFFNEAEEIIANCPNTREKEKFSEVKGINNKIALKDSVLYQEGEMFIFLSKLYNGSNEDITELKKEISLLNKDGKEIGRIRMIAVDVKVDEMVPIVTQTRDLQCNIEDVYDFRVNW